jgi:predicted HicB family RNase H-like nuclease
MPVKEPPLTVYTNVAVRIEPSVREQAKAYARTLGISLNEYVASAMRNENERQARREKMNDQQPQIELVR